MMNRNILSFRDFLLEKENTSPNKSLLDFNNSLVFQTIKDIRTATIGGKEYTFYCVGSGMKSYAESSEQNKETLNKIAERKDQVLVFAPDGIHVITEAVFNGLISLASCVYPYVKEGSISIGAGIISGFKKINEYYKQNGESSFDQMKEEPTTLCKIIITDLYKLLNVSPKASEGISLIVVGAYNSVSSSFKTVPNFLQECVYSPAKELNIQSVKYGENIDTFHKVAENTLRNLSIPITKLVESGLEKIASSIEKGIHKYNKENLDINKQAYDALESAQKRIAPSGKVIISKSRPIWDSIFSKKD
jgi:hypothetical protein